MAEGLGADVLRAFAAEWYYACLQGEICWLRVWVLNPKWLVKEGMEVADCALSFTYILEFTLHLRRITENLSPGSRVKLGIFLSTWLPCYPATATSLLILTSGDFGQHKFLRGTEGSPY